MARRRRTRQRRRTRRRTRGGESIDRARREFADITKYIIKDVANPYDEGRMFLGINENNGKQIVVFCNHEDKLIMLLIRGFDNASWTPMNNRPIRPILSEVQSQNYDWSLLSYSFERDIKALYRELF